MKPIVLDPNAFGTSFGACFWLLSFLRWAAWQAFDISLPRRLLVCFFSACGGLDFAMHTLTLARSATTYGAIQF